MGQKVVVVGVGVIGSFLVALLARLPGLSELVLIDHDRYEPRNLMTQWIGPADIGMEKVVVQSRRALDVNPSLKIRTFHARVEDVPVGLFRDCVVLACLDNNRARLALNAIAQWMGSPLIDAGVRGGEDLLARVAVYAPGDGQACLECGLSAEDYDALGAAFSCSGQVLPDTRASNAPAALGALAASHQFFEYMRFSGGDTSMTGSEALVDVAGKRQILSRKLRNPNCRFEHRSLQAQALPADLGARTLGDLLEVSGSMSVVGNQFMSQVVCMACGERRSMAALERVTRVAPPRCQQCGHPVQPLGFSLRDSLAAGSDSAELFRHTTLYNAGFRFGDVVRLGERFFELTPPEECHA